MLDILREEARRLIDDVLESYGKQPEQLSLETLCKLMWERAQEEARQAREEAMAKALQAKAQRKAEEREAKEKAERDAASAAVSLCLGTSLQILPASSIPERTVTRKG